jgi:hypothetical protein
MTLTKRRHFIISFTTTIENRRVKEEKGNNDLITILNMLF